MTAKTKKPTARKAPAKKAASASSGTEKKEKPAAAKTKAVPAKKAVSKVAAGKTAESKTSAGKTAAAKKPAAKKTAAKSGKTLKPTAPNSVPVPAAQKVKPAVVNAPQPVMMGPAMRKKEIIEAVVARSGLKKRDIKPAIDQLLAVMGEALADGRELVVPPLGRVKVHKKKDVAKKTIYFTKIHQNAAPALPDTDTDIKAG